MAVIILFLILLELYHPINRYSSSHRKLTFRRAAVDQF
uniref:Uncharacterized protein n=1 Tax=Arundo donax TaxID=35708 RepID=A0A0A9C5E3_ARUDO